MKNRIKDILQDTDYSLSPIFSVSNLAFIFNALWITAVALFVFWPKKRLFYYFISEDVPINFLVVSVTVLIATSLIGLISGTGFMIKERFGFRIEKIEVVTLEEQMPFLTYGLVKFFVQTILALVALLPFLLIAASLSKLSLTTLMSAIFILILSPMLLRLVGFVIYLRYGKWSQIGHIWAFGFFLVYFIGTGFIGSMVNPALLIAALLNEESPYIFGGVHVFSVYVGSSLLCIMALSVGIHYRLKTRTRIETI